MKQYWWGLGVLALALGGCGGGGMGDTPAEAGAKLAAAPRATVELARCQAGEAGVAMAGGECLAVFNNIAAPARAAKAKAPQAPQAALDVNTLFDWAGRNYSSLFAGTYQSGSIAVPPFGTFFYRYYPATGNYLANLGTDVYVYGPLSAYQIQMVGAIADFTCVVQSCSGGGTTGGSGGGTTGGNTTGVGASVTPGSSVSDAFYYANGSVQHSVYLYAGTSYVMSLNGSPSGAGTLADPYLDLKNSAGTVVASNDDMTGSLDSQITYTAPTTGYYYLLARSYGSGYGSYRLSVSAGSGGTGGSTGGGTSGGSSSYITWTGSVNGTIVKDSGNESFQVRASDRLVVAPSGSSLTGLTVNSSANIVYNGSVIGYVGTAAAANGSGNVAAFYCSNGTYMDIIVTSSWTYSCGGTSSGGGSTGGGSTGGGSTGGGSSSRSFTTWTGSANGEVVLDSTNESFRFYHDNGCIYSDNTRTEYTNFCIGASNTLTFSGVRYSVTNIRSTNGSCITGLVTSDGYFADIYTGNGRIEYIQKSSQRPVGC